MSVGNVGSECVFVVLYLEVFTHVIEVRRTLRLVEDPRHDEDPRRPGVLPEHVDLPVEEEEGEEEEEEEEKEEEE